MKRELFSLENKVIVVTGGAGLLGLQHIEAIHRFGGQPVMLDISHEAIEKGLEQLRKCGIDNVWSHTLDVTDENQVREVSELIQQELGNIDGLVNNAAINPKVEKSNTKNFSRLEFFDLQQWQLELSVGLTGAFLCTKYFGSAMAKAGNGGSIVNICSDLGVIAPDQRLYEQPELPEEQQPVKPVTYSVIKSGLIGLSKYVSTYWPHKNIRCNALCPGGIENDQPADFLEKISSRIPMARMARKDEYQGTLVWMLSDASSYLNGAVINVDGGRTAW
ncbi:MAG: SDR family oxidoreductase [Aestuariibacter sp.]